MEKITKPGVYDLPADFYHSDCCDGPSLSSTGARAIISTCPAKFKYDRDNPQEKRAFDLGRAGHLMVLEPEKVDSEIVIVRGFTKQGKPAKGYSTDDAIEQRDRAYAAGKTPLLPEEYDALKAMRDVLWNDPVMSKAFMNGKTEQSVFWKCKETGIWCKMRPDFLPNAAAFLADYKTTTDAGPDGFPRSVFKFGYHQQAAWYSEGYKEAFGVDLSSFWFIAQETKAPFLTGAYRVSPDALEAGRLLNIRARRIFAWCNENNHWPGYLPTFDGSRVFYDVDMPPWLAREHETRLETDWYNNIEGMTP